MCPGLHQAVAIQESALPREGHRAVMAPMTGASSSGSLKMKERIEVLNLPCSTRPVKEWASNQLRSAATKASAIIGRLRKEADRRGMS